MSLRYVSVCSGIEAASVAWHPLGMRAVAFSEVHPFCRAVLRERWPGVPIFRDFRRLDEKFIERTGPVDVLVGGPPCQDFSIAGDRAGVDGERGSLALDFVALADRLRTRWVVFENVPGLLSISQGRAFGTILGKLGEFGYGFAYRILDAQYFGLPQRRERLYLVAHFGDWRRAAAVLLEPESLQGNPPPRRETGQKIAGPLGGSSQTGGFRTTDLDNQGAYIAYGGNNTSGAIELATACRAKGGTGHGDFESETFITVPLVADPLSAHEQRTYSHEGSHNFRLRNVVPGGTGIRRLTPLECERLQGFPDNYTLIHSRGHLARDGERYKAIGNAMPVPVMRWIGERILMVEEILCAGSTPGASYQTTA